MGVHKPSIKRNPATRRIAAVIVMFSGGSPHSRKLARSNQHAANDRAHEKQAHARPAARKCGIEASHYGPFQPL